MVDSHQVLDTISAIFYDHQNQLHETLNNQLLRIHLIFWLLDSTNLNIYKKLISSWR